MNTISDDVRRLFSVEGKASRSDFALIQVVFNGVSILVIALLLQNESPIQAITEFLGVPFILIVIYANIATIIRRHNDIGTSPLRGLLILIPYLGLGYYFYLFIAPGKG